MSNVTERRQRQQSGIKNSSGSADLSITKLIRSDTDISPSLRQTEPPAELDTIRYFDDDNQALVDRMNRRTNNIERFINTVPTLEQDGSNLLQWKERTAQAIFAVMGVPNYWAFEKPKGHSQWLIAVNWYSYWVLHETIPDDIWSLLNPRIVRI
ncbi:hypothetical protein CROQUDRAFT_94096 [Cronartium quercuum f. sp. fusiforme G11]|uniref:Uncharacterized protein n=1 Tax=Cronartium quercuum f. sp. fusiforme G11 TaxID=708437 RepID=A0A9P6NGM7_9BASI|nr:hypothetical protein CROQUDRAFT_94096 [Cronartium quercuum f. sp. fusiforme G11]